MRQKGIEYGACSADHRVSMLLLGEIFLNNHKSNSAADTNARDSAIVCSIALQYGADLNTLRRALSRDSYGRALGALGAALDHLADDSQ